MLLCGEEINDQKYNPCIQFETIHFRLTTAITKIEKIWHLSKQRENSNRILKLYAPRASNKFLQGINVVEKKKQKPYNSTLYLKGATNSLHTQLCGFSDKITVAFTMPPVPFTLSSTLHQICTLFLCSTFSFLYYSIDFFISASLVRSKNIKVEVITALPQRIIVVVLYPWTELP